MNNKIKDFIRKNTILYFWIKSIYYFIKKIKSILLYSLALFPIKNNKLLIINYCGKGFGDNGKAIINEIINQNLNYDIVWSIKNNKKNIFPNEVRTVKFNSFRFFFELITSKIWINNCRMPLYTWKRKKQFYIQAWHGGIALKKIEKDAKDRLDKYYIKSAKKDSKMANLFLSNSNFCTNIYKKAFWYDGEILECGSPRCDCFFNDKNEVNLRVRKYFDIDNNSKILIYAPTFRLNESTEVYNIDFEKLISCLENKFNCKWKILARLHPNISYKHGFIKYTSNIINATNYEDMYDILNISDILITDYSSTMFEFSIMHKPVFLYATDIEEYKNDRNFYFNIFNLPYKVAQSNDELLQLITCFEEKKYLSELRSFLLKLGICEYGNASKQVVDIIKKVI